MLGDTNFNPRVERKVLHRGVKFDLEQVGLEGRGGRIVREVVRHPGAVIVLPVLRSGGSTRIVLIRNWRLSLESWLWELPAGTLGRGEDPLACAARELREETGFAAATLRPLSRFHTSPGLSDEVMWAFVAEGLEGGIQALEEDERVTVHPTAVDVVFEMIRRGELTDAKSMLTMHLARAAGEI